MNESQHTPGPWTRDMLSNSKGWPVRSGEPEFGPVICTVHGKFATLGNPGAANARLIAAAPELLAALTELNGLIDSALTGPDPDGALDRMTDVVRAALAKAGAA